MNKVSSQPQPQPQRQQQRAPEQSYSHGVDTRFAAAALVSFATSYLNLGLGVRFGKTLSNGIYLGGTFMFHAGTSISAREVSTSAFYFGAEGGYDFDVGPVVIRPYLGLGLMRFNVAGYYSTYVEDGSLNRLVVWPGGSVIYGFPSSPFFVGGDVRLITVPGGPSFGIAAVGGIRFGS